MSKKGLDRWSLRLDRGAHDKHCPLKIIIDRTYEKITVITYIDILTLFS